MRARRSVLAAMLATLAAFATAARAADCPPAKLTIVLPTDSPRQGAIFRVTARSAAPLARGTLHDGRREIAMEVAESGRTLSALVGIDFETAAGTRTLRMDAVGACGEPQGAARKIAVVSGRFPTQKLKVDPAYVEPPEDELERIQRDREKVARVWANADTARRWGAPFRAPVASAAPGDFGARRVFNGKPRSRHSGVNLAAPQGTEIAAPAPALVALAEDLYFSGGTVILDHGGGLLTTYFPHVVDRRLARGRGRRGAAHRCRRRDRTRDRAASPLGSAPPPRQGQPARSFEVTDVAERGVR